MKVIKLFFLIAFVSSISGIVCGQNVLLLRDQDGNKDCVIRQGRRLSIKDLDEKKIRGKLFAVTDSSLIVIKKNVQTEIPLHNIHYIFYHNKNGWKTAMGSVLSYTGLASSAMLGLGSQTAASANNGLSGSLGITMAVAGSIGAAGSFTGIYFAFFHRTKYDVQTRYRMIPILDLKPAVEERHRY